VRTPSKRASFYTRRPRVSTLLSEWSSKRPRVYSTLGVDSRRLPRFARSVRAPLMELCSIEQSEMVKRSKRAKRYALARWKCSGLRFRDPRRANAIKNYVSVRIRALALQSNAHSSRCIKLCSTLSVTQQDVLRAALVLKSATRKDYNLKKLVRKALCVRHFDVILVVHSAAHLALLASRAP
jgi:hypothetical protein